MHLLASPALLLLAELVALYVLGSFALGRLGALAYGNMLQKLAFYLLVLPGVILHETAHYLVCKLTGTRVSDFAPFSPARTPDGRLQLGYVRHASRGILLDALIGMAPLLLNPLGVWLVTVLLTPLSPAELSVLAPGRAVAELQKVFSEPLQGVLWIYLAGSFALGAIPSREDLVGVPAALLLTGAVALLAGMISPVPLLEVARFTVERAVTLLFLPTLLAAVLAAITALGRG